MSVETLINNLKDGDNVAASKAFSSVMGEKLRSALNAEKIKVASSMGNPVVEEPEEVAEKEVDTAED